MGLLKQEQEITITKIADEKEFSVYISDPKYKRKMDKLEVEPYKIDILDDEEVGWFYKINEKMISIRKIAKKREFTEEERMALAERLKSMRNNKENYK